MRQQLSLCAALASILATTVGCAPSDSNYEADNHEELSDQSASPLASNYGAPAYRAARAPLFTGFQAYSATGLKATRGNVEYRLPISASSARFAGGAGQVSSASMNVDLTKLVVGSGIPTESVFSFFAREPDANFPDRIPAEASREGDGIRVALPDGELEIVLRDGAMEIVGGTYASEISEIFGSRIEATVSTSLGAESNRMFSSVRGDDQVAFAPELASLWASMTTPIEKTRSNLEVGYFGPSVQKREFTRLLEIAQTDYSHPYITIRCTAGKNIFSRRYKDIGCFMHINAPVVQSDAQGTVNEGNIEGAYASALYDALSEASPGVHGFAFSQGEVACARSGQGASERTRCFVRAESRNSAVQP